MFKKNNKTKKECFIRQKTYWRNEYEKESI